MTPERITRLIARRNKLTNRRDGRINWPALREVDELLSEVPAGTDNTVDLLLGRPGAKLPTRPDYGLTAAQEEQYRAMSEGQPDGIVEHDDALAGAWM